MEEPTDLLASVTPVADAPSRPHAVTLPILAFHGDEPVRHLNRELSWLQFDERVLAIAEDTTQPLLERAKFLAIFAANLDEFFQVRVAGLKEQLAAGVTGTGADGMGPAEQLVAIAAIAGDLTARHARVFHAEVGPQLAEHGIHLCDEDQLGPADRAWLDEMFDERVFPVLTPLAVDPAHPFPYISNLSLNLAVVVRDHDGETRFARVKIPPILPRFVPLPDGDRFVPLEQVIAAHLPRLFPGLEVVEHHTFRVTRNADLVVEQDEADDLLAAIETELTRRRFGRAVRLEIEPTMSEEVLDLLVRELAIDPGDVQRLTGPLDLTGLWALYELDRPELKHPSSTSSTQPRLAAPSGEGATATGRTSNDLFATLREGDVLVQHPYESFTTSVQAFVEQAARDPDVLAIKQTLYRTSGPGSPIVRALLTAAAEGKQVVALVELQARFDEEANIEWARLLEEAGVHVAYGVVGYKTHTKISLVVRNEADGVRRYAHIGTGNYNDRTARIYEDLGVLTADPDLGADLTDLFNVLTGYSRQDRYRKLLVAPTTLLPRLLELIEREAAAEDGHIVAKMNALIDTEIIDALYDASQRGTRIELIVRGTCGLRPGVEGLSDHIRVRSIVGRYLEHSRIFRFGSAARGHDYFVGSADWMERNLRRRVEAVAPVTDPRLQERLEQILQLNLADDRLAWELGPDATWTRVPTTRGIDTHLALRELARRRSAGSR